PAEGPGSMSGSSSPESQCPGSRSIWVPDISLTRNSGMTANTSETALGSRWDRLAPRQSVLDHQLYDLAGIGHGLVVGVALGAHLGQRRHGDYEPALFRGLEDNGERVRLARHRRQLSTSALVDESRWLRLRAQPDRFPSPKKPRPWRRVAI